MACLGFAAQLAVPVSKLWLLADHFLEGIYLNLAEANRHLVHLQQTVIADKGFRSILGPVESRWDGVVAILGRNHRLLVLGNAPEH